VQESCIHATMFTLLSTFRQLKTPSHHEDLFTLLSLEWKTNVYLYASSYKNDSAKINFVCNTNKLTICCGWVLCKKSGGYYTFRNPGDIIHSEIRGILYIQKSGGYYTFRNPRISYYCQFHFSSANKYLHYYIRKTVISTSTY
jgi:hypothetical protein